MAIHTALGPVACPLPHRSLPVPLQLACGLAHMRGVAAGTLISLAIEPRVTAPHVNFRLRQPLEAADLSFASTPHVTCERCVWLPFMELKVAVLGPKIADFFLAGRSPAPRWGPPPQCPDPASLRRLGRQPEAAPDPVYIRSGLPYRGPSLNILGS